VEEKFSTAYDAAELGCRRKGITKGNRIGGRVGGKRKKIKDSSII